MSQSDRTGLVHSDHLYDSCVAETATFEDARGNKGVQSEGYRSDGLGGFVARQVPHWVVAAVTVLSALVCILVLPIGRCWWVLLYFVVTVSFFNLWMYRKFGGTTGDTYGAQNEIMEWVGWLVFAAIGN